MRIDPYGRQAIAAALLRRQDKGYGKAPVVAPAEPYAPTPFMTKVDDLNRSVLQASLSQAEEDFNIHRLMFEPVANVRRPREVVQ